MTLSNPQVIDALNSNFVSGWRNIEGKTSYAGRSNKHMPENPAINVNTCAGHHNVQMFFMSSDRKVLHVLPGYWQPKDFLAETKLALELDRIYRSKSLSIADRNSQYLDSHLKHAYSHDRNLTKGARLVNFDRKFVQRRGVKDFQRKALFKGSGLKHADQVVHERMAERPFISFDRFDVARYIRMGRKRYQYNYGLMDRDRKVRDRGSR